MRRVCYISREGCKKYLKPNCDPISYQTATGYMSAFKCSMIDHYHLQGVPQQFQTHVWSRMLGKIKSIKYDYARKAKIRLLGSKEAASKNDKMALGTVCLWSGTLDYAEFMNLFNGMVYNCGRGNEIAITHNK